MDWYRFVLPKAQAVQIALGDLPSNHKLQLYHGCGALLALGSLVAASPRGDRPDAGLRGRYSVRVSGHGGFDISDPVPGPDPAARDLGPSCCRHGRRSRRPAADRRRSPERRHDPAGPVTVRAACTTRPGHLLATWTKAAYLPVLASLARSPFLFVGAAPAGFDHAVLSVASAPVTTAAKISPSVSGAGSAPDAGTWTVTGTVRNTSTSTTMRSVRVFITEYDTLGNVIAVGTSRRRRRRSGGAGRRRSARRSGP